MEIHRDKPTGQDKLTTGERQRRAYFEEVLRRSPILYLGNDSIKNDLREHVSVRYIINNCLRVFPLNCEGYIIDLDGNIKGFTADPTIDQICKNISQVYATENEPVLENIIYTKRLDKDSRFLSFKFGEIEPLLEKVAKERFPEFKGQSLLEIGNNLRQKDQPTTE